MEQRFEVIGNIEQVRMIAVNRSINELDRLKRIFGGGRWRKLKGVATIRLADGSVHRAELHWYEAHGIGKRKMKIKRVLW